MHKLFPILLIIKIVSPIITLADHSLCPWMNTSNSNGNGNYNNEYTIDQNASNKNNDDVKQYLHSIRATVDTLFKTFYCTYLITLVMGYKISRYSLDRNYIKLLVIVGASSYLTYSLFTLGQHVPILNISTSILVIVFSVFMITLLCYLTT
jgi:hypothetical protein